VNGAVEIAAQDLVDRASREVEFRILERQFVRDLARHPEIPAAAAVAALDQWLAGGRVDARVYDALVQHLADTSVRGLERRGVLDEAVAAGCGVCRVRGLTEHE
jgi:hypothetical protein